MHVIRVDDVNEALPQGLAYLRDNGTLRQTRNGPALVAPGPVATVYTLPWRRVLFDAVRDANPFFHLFESLWILAGRDDVSFLAFFNKRMTEFSDNGVVFHAPYGFRLRHQFGFDQIERAIDMLKQNPEDRRVVLQIWDARTDLGKVSKDLPCNDLVFLSISAHHRLEMSVCNRSNDVLWGAYGANAVQFSMLQEYIAGRVGVSIGRYTQISNNYHVYLSNPYWEYWSKKNQSGVFVPVSPYSDSTVSIRTTDLFDLSTAEVKRGAWFDSDLRNMFLAFDSTKFMSNGFQEILETSFRSKFFNEVVRPMLLLWMNRDLSAPELQSRVPSGERDIDWLRAGVEWVQRRERKTA